jgi:FtsH-binding integral membrane protein
LEEAVDLSSDRLLMMMMMMVLMQHLSAQQEIIRLIRQYINYYVCCIILFCMIHVMVAISGNSNPINLINVIIFNKCEKVRS